MERVSAREGTGKDSSIVRTTDSERHDPRDEYLVERIDMGLILIPHADQMPPFLLKSITLFNPRKRFEEKISPVESNSNTTAADKIL
jgi:hypothetical protein